MIFTKRQKMIIGYLHKNKTWVKGKDLASFFNVSSRTIRNDVLSIKQYTQDNIIIASKINGYSINSTFKPISTIVDISFIEANDRLLFILSKLIFNKTNTVNFYELSEELYISEFTLQSDINSLKKFILDSNLYDIDIIKSGDLLILSGNKKIHDKLLVLLVTTLYTSPDINTLSNIFTTFDIRKLYDCVTNFLIEINFSSRYLLLFDIVLYISITLQRTYLDIKPCKIEKNTLSNNEKNFSKLLFEIIEKEFFIDICEDEKLCFAHNISSLLSFELLEKNFRNSKEISEELLNKFKKSLEQINDEFNIELEFSNEILNNIIRHLQLFILRVQNGIIIHNPLKENIRNQYPFLYDVAISLCNKLFINTKIKLTDTEISYLVAYLGISFKEYENKFSFKTKLSILLIVIEGNATLNHITSIIYDFFDKNKINIVGVSNFNDLDLNFINYNMVISTSKLVTKTVDDSIYINPAFTIVDQFEVKNLISSSLKKLDEQNFNTIFNHFFNENFFEFDIDVTTRNEAINYLCNKLIKKGYIDSNYTDSIFERENLISTALSCGISLPHATNARSFKTVVFVGNFKKAINWNGQKVKSTFLFAISKEDSSIVNVLYNYIINIINNTNIINELQKCNSFDKLKQLLHDSYFSK